MTRKKSKDKKKEEIHASLYAEVYPHLLRQYSAACRLRGIMVKEVTASLMERWLKDKDMVVVESHVREKLTGILYTRLPRQLTRRYSAACKLHGFKVRDVCISLMKYWIKEVGETPLPDEE